MKALISVFILVIKYIEFSLYVQNVLYMHREGLSSIPGYSSSEIVSISTFYKYFVQKTYVLAADEV